MCILFARMIAAVFRLSNAVCTNRPNCMHRKVLRQLHVCSDIEMQECEISSVCSDLKKMFLGRSSQLFSSLKQSSLAFVLLTSDGKR